MAQNITLLGASYSDVPAVELPKTGGGTATFTDTSDADATASNILYGKTAYVNGSKVTGSITQRQSSDVTANGGTVTVPSGYYQSQVNRSVGTGSISAPTFYDDFSQEANTVHVSIGYTVTGGYIAGGTQTRGNHVITASQLVGGTLPITSNGTVDVTNYASVNVSVSGGSSNYVTGTFTPSGSGVTGSLTIPYSGSGYPILCMVFIKGGAYNTSVSGWYNSTQRYAVGQWTMHKSVTTSSPTYTTSGTQNYGVTTAIYKNSTSSSTSYTRTSGMNTNVFSSSNASNAALTCVRFKSATSLSYYVASTSYGLMSGVEYEYHVVYSS